MRINLALRAGCIIFAKFGGRIRCGRLRWDVCRPRCFRSPLLIMERMRKFRNILLPLFAACALTAQAAEEDAAAALERGRDLFDFGRWCDARPEFLRARAASDPADRTTVEEIDF